MTNQLHTRRPAARRVPRVAVASALRIPLPTAHCPLPTSSHPRRGISLLEVLISMFVLLFGLMGVAAIFPVGNHYAAKGEQADRGTALAEAAMADLKARGMLNPNLWRYANRPLDDNSGIAGTQPIPVLLPTGEFNVVPFDLATNGPGYAFVIDPMGSALGFYDTTPITVNLDYFPYASLVDASTPEGAPNTLMPNEWRQNLPAKQGLVASRWPVRRISFQTPDPANPTNPPTLMNSRVAETVFRLHDDVTNELPKQDDRPAIQRWSVDTGGYPLEEPWNHTLLARQYAGAFSWLATIVPTSADSLAALQPLNSRFGSDLYEVSVAVFNKREPIPPSAATERLIEAQMLQGNELVIYGTNTDDFLAAENVNNAVKDIRAGQWIAVSGVHPTTGAFMMKWYRILSLDDETQEGQPILDSSGNYNGSYPIRRAMLDGVDWPLTKLNAAGVRADINARAILLPGVISVATQMLPMEAQ